MPDRGILVLDLGLSAVKATLFSLDGRRLATAQRSITTRSPHPGWYVQDPEEWWVRAVEAARCVRSAANLDAIEGVAVTGHMHAPVLVDLVGRPLADCPVIWDRRPEAEWAELGRAFDVPAHHVRTGGRVGPQAVPAKLRWLSRHTPEVLTRAHVLLAPKDFLRLRLTGEACTDPTDAAGLLLLDLRQGAWALDLAEAAGLRPELLPRIVPSASIAGTLTRDAARALGVEVETPVVAGAGDDVEVLGLGAIRPGDVYEHLGSTGTLSVVTDQLALDSRARVETVPHPYPGHWLVGGSTNAACAALDHIRRLVGHRDDDDSWDDALNLSLDSADRRPFFLPYLAGERAPLWDDSLRGAFVGLQLTTDRNDLLASVLEGIAFSLRDISEVLGELNLAQRRVYASGGGATIRGWARLRASVYGLPILTPREGDSTTRGAFLLAAVGLSVFTTLDDALRAAPIAAEVSEPDRETAAYALRHQAFRALVQTLTPWFRTSPHICGNQGGDNVAPASQ